MALTTPISAAFLLLVCVSGSHANDSGDAAYRLYLDLSQSGGAREAGLSIERGVRAALHTVGNQLGGRSVELVIRDHRASTPRSRRHLEEFVEDPDGLAVIGGMHSPPILSLRDWINESEIPLLVPWAAAAPITRSKGAENWIFRLSVDDSKAGYAITQGAVEEEGYRRPFLLLEDTGWGESNLRTMTAAIEASPANLAGVARFPWGTKALTAREIVDDALRAGADVLFLVANSEEGIQFANAVLSLPAETRLPVRSHWGITGGEFFGAIGADRMTQLDLRVIQSRFSFLSATNARTQHVLDVAAELFPELGEDPARMRAALGFVHAFDLTLILANAADRLPKAGDIRAARRSLRESLERVTGPVEGLMKDYRYPFRPFSGEDIDAHEALGLNDLRMGRYMGDGSIELAPAPASNEN